MYQDGDKYGGKPVELDDRDVQEMGESEPPYDGPVELHAGSGRQGSF